MAIVLGIQAKCGHTLTVDDCSMNNFRIRFGFKRDSRLDYALSKSKAECSNLTTSALGRWVFVALIVVGVGCERPGADSEQLGDTGEVEAVQAVPIMVASVERKTMASRITAASTIEAEAMVVIHAESTGRLTNLRVEEGIDVKKGQLLGRIVRDAQTASLERAMTNLRKATLDRDRVRELFSQGAASQQELDNAEAQLKIAQLDRVDRARDVKNTRIIATISGKVTERFVNRGSFVSTGAKLFSITDFSTLVARVYVPENELDRLNVGQEATIVGSTANRRQGVGKIARIAPIVDPTTGTVKVTIELPPDLAGGEKGFLPGMYAEVSMTTTLHENVLVVPKSAVVYDEDRSFLFFAHGDICKRVFVELGISEGNVVEVISNIDEKGELVVAGQIGLKDGAKIVRVDADGTPLERSEKESLAIIPVKRGQGT